MLFHQIENAHVTQITLKVKDLEHSVEFYTKILGFQKWKGAEGHVSLSGGEGRPLLHLEDASEAFPPERKATGLYHFALLLPEKADLADLVKHLSRNNIPLASADHFVSEAIYFSDPDGNGIEVYIDRPSSLWQWTGNEVKMTVDPLDFDHLFYFGTNDGWFSLPERTIMGHVHLHVADLEEAERFYCEGLGFDVVNRFGNQALFISTAGYHHHIGLNTWKGVGAPAPGRSELGLKWFDIQYPDAVSLGEAVMRIRVMGAPVEEEDGVFYTMDPSQNRIRLYVFDNG